MTATKVQLKALERTILGRKVSSLRAAALIPANIYAKSKQSVAVSLDKKEFTKLYSSAGETTLINLDIDGEKTSRPVLIREVQRHPVTGEFLHVDFQQVDLKQKVTANIPVIAVGESEAVKAGGVLVLAFNELEVEALPTDLPEHFEVDLSRLQTIGDTITVGQLSYDSTKVTLSAEAEDVVATVQAQAEEQAEEVPAEPVEVELTKQGATKAEEESQEGAAQ